MFELNDIILAYETYKAAAENDFEWLYLMTDDGFLEKYDRLSKKKKSSFEDRLSQALHEVIPVEEPEDIPCYHDQLSEIFADFL